MSTHGDGGWTAAVRAAAVAELCWLGEDRRPGAAPVVPLTLAGDPVVAVPYAHAHWARTVAASPEVALVLSDPRMAGSGWRPLAVSGRPTLVEDEEGDVFTAQLLEEELRKHPPSRAFIDSPMLRREHWWYLPRLLLRVEGGAVEAVGQREGDREVVLAVASSRGALGVDTVRVEEWDVEPLTLTSLTGQALADGPAVLLGHDFSVPDLERWTPHVTTGTLTKGRLAVAERPAGRELEPVPGLRARLRRHRALEKACVAALGRR